MTSNAEQMKGAYMDGVIEVTCPSCRDILRCEPDAREVYCECCEKVVTPKDSLVSKGLI